MEITALELAMYLLEKVKKNGKDMPIVASRISEHSVRLSFKTGDSLSPFFQAIPIEEEKVWKGVVKEKVGFGRD